MNTPWSRDAAAIDNIVGSRIRARRVMLGMTQGQLGDAIGVTYQQTHKYERGINRISAGRLYEIAHVLNAPVMYFFEGGGGDTAPSLKHQRMLLELARNFGKIKSARHKEAVAQVARTLAAK